jgi:DNA-binding NtrC family response regulator
MSGETKTAPCPRGVARTATQADENSQNVAFLLGSPSCFDDTAGVAGAYFSVTPPPLRLDTPSPVGYGLEVFPAELIETHLPFLPLSCSCLLRRAALRSNLIGHRETKTGWRSCFPMVNAANFPDRTTAPGCISMIGMSPVMQAIRRDLSRIANSTSTVLITGETGTGKELAADYTHEHIPRRNSAFVCVNCAAIPDNLLESELFGHAKGAYTGADQHRDGLFLSANGGTIFLDEVGDMSLCAQAKILRVIEQREVFKVGSNRGTRLDIRLVAATNQDLEAMANRGTFRKDLYFRLNVARVEDIPSLLRYYCADMSRKTGWPVPQFSEASLRCMIAYEWPGNIRELRNMVERLSLMDLPRMVEAEHLPLTMRGESKGSPSSSFRERETLLAALCSCKWNKSEAAKKLRWSRMTLYRKLAKYQISAEIAVENEMDAVRAV